MKIIQINGWLGRLSGPLSRFIEKEKPDFVCLQEAFRPNSKVMKVFEDQYGYIDQIIKAGGFRHNFFTPAWGFEMGSELIEEGNLILSKYPISNFKELHINGEYHVRSSSNAIPNTRVWHACNAKLPNGKSVTISNYQGYVTGTDSFGDKVTVGTLKKVYDCLATLTSPLIFCCDLNISVASPAIEILNSLGLVNLVKNQNVKTTLSPVHRAPLRDRNNVACDYIFVSKDVQVKGLSISEEIVSDHKALVLDFDI